MHGSAFAAPLLVLPCQSHRLSSPTSPKRRRCPPLLWRASVSPQQRASCEPPTRLLSPPSKPAPPPTPSPTPVQLLTRAYFTAFFALCLTTASALSRLVHVLHFGSTERRRDERCVSLAQACFRGLMLGPCPWIRLRGVDELQAALRDAADEAAGSPYILCNHNSPMDSLLVAALLPKEVGRNVRSLIKAALLDEPLFGSLCRDCGHFPVHFKDPSSSTLSVDKELQAPVTERVDRFIAENGALCLFPEGTLNRTGNPRQLQSFRRGGFTLSMKHKKAMWGVLNAGCYESWPVGHRVGGWPATIDVQVVKICDDASLFESNAALAEYAQMTMQATLDGMYARRDEEAARAAVGK